MMRDIRHIPVFISSDDNFAPFVATAIASVCYNTKSFIEFYVLDSGISDFHKRQIEMLHNRFANFSLEFIRLPYLEKSLGGVKPLNNLSYAAYSRFFIADIKPNVDKAIYLDADIIALDDISLLYDEDLGEYELGAVYDFGIKEKKVKHNIKVFGLKREHLYFNSGVLLINCKKWRENNIFDKLVKIAIDTQSIRNFNDQDVLNIYYNDNYKQLEPKYNVLSNIRQAKKFLHYQKKTMVHHVVNDYKNVLAETVIRHFSNSKMRPNDTNEDIFGDKLLNCEDYWFFVAMTEFHAGLLMGFMASVINMPKNTK